MVSRVWPRRSIVIAGEAARFTTGVAAAEAGCPLRSSTRRWSARPAWWPTPWRRMLCRVGGRCLRPLTVLQLQAGPPPLAPSPGSASWRPALPGWAMASASAVAPGGAGGWYEALAESAPVRGAEELLLSAHAATGLPWWGSILFTTVALRGAVTLPLAAYQHYILAKVENLQPEIKNIARHVNQEVAIRAHQLGWSKRVARLTYIRNMRRLVSELYIRDNCHPFKATVLVWIQLPMWVFMSVALRNFSIGATHSEGFSVQEQLATGGILWFPDLTALDSTWILPVSVGVINLLIVEIFALQKIGMSRFQMYTTHFVRGVSVLMIPIAATVPSSIVLYWLCSSFMGLSQNLLLRSPGFRQLCRIPLTKSDSDTPYKDLFAAFYAKFISRK
ncbi:cytochrome c oxidase assembly protein COX18, mitochondrial isoform X2 [Tupaia chinensis]|uniref:cytochrome c oxidase assembly protein COX18, mitochondrial isoform X2 n=1 Tax=Tupaia chinensis TaxID=246437 RepID=UPI000FFB32CC|nr:cytochrome c oxidase assembly protein COX18, mitochondrial isoform X2 [Tupaia chinensis]